MSNISRRGFVQGAAMGAVAISSLSAASFAAADEVKAEPKVDEELSADLVIVGAGGAGLTAAIQARELGVSVILVEKNGKLGGSAGSTEGVFGVASPLQRAAGIPDIPICEVIEEEMAYTAFRSCGPLLVKYFNASGANIQWLMDQGVQFKEVSNYRGISSFDCFHWWEGNRGASMIATLSDRAVEVGAQTYLNTRATDLVWADGKVAGVYAYNAGEDKGYKFNAKAVILSSGGFAGDMERVAQMTWVDTTYAASYGSNMGDGIRMALEAGCGTTAVCGLYKTKVLGPGIPSVVSTAACFEPALMVNEFGSRFAREDLNITSYSALYFNTINSQRKAFTILDGNMVDVLENQGILYAFGAYAEGSKMEGLADGLVAMMEADNPYVASGNTLEELAENAGFDVATFTENVARYNELCEQGYDADFGKGAAYMIACNKPPYYAIRQVPTVFVTIGGIDVDINNQVVTPEGKVIPNLYSAGVDCCKLYKETYNYQLSGGMIGYCIYSGRVAAQTAIAKMA